MAPQERENKRQNQHLDDEDCQDRVCMSVKKDLKNWMGSETKKPQGKFISRTATTEKGVNLECPLDKDSLGRNTWSLLHTMAAQYPVRPTDKNKSDMKEFINLLSVLYPCSHCATDFRRDIKESPPKLESRTSLAQWFCQMHNKVNKKLAKPDFDCSKVEERWRTGWKDGSCDPF